MPRAALRQSSSAPAWSKHRPARPQRCDLCMRLLAENDGAGPFPRDAKWKRTAAGETTLLCHPHAAHQRQIDQLPPLKVPPGPPPARQRRP